jgi:hypothetical protein
MRDLMMNVHTGVTDNITYTNVCCLNVNEGGMGMINIDNYVKSKEMQSI